MIYKLFIKISLHRFCFRVLITIILYHANRTSMSTLLTFLYGAAVLIILYHIVHVLYSVYYTPGSTTLYNSSVTQAIFPSETKKLAPTWGTNDLGMIKGDPTKYGRGDFWPSSGQGYVPDKYASGGASPSGGMRDAPPVAPVELRPGYDPLPSFRQIYEQHPEIPEKKVWPVGWWGQ